MNIKVYFLTGCQIVIPIGTDFMLNYRCPHFFVYLLSYGSKRMSQVLLHMKKKCKPKDETLIG